MKAILEFDFDKEDSDDRLEFQDAINGTKWKMLVWDLDQHLRTKTKYASDNDNPEAVNALYVLREHLHDLLVERKLDIHS